ncbi:MAG: hypothetical protein ACI86H_000663, partial [bacterium]
MKTIYSKLIFFALLIFILLGCASKKNTISQGLEKRQKELATKITALEKSNKS